LSGVDVDQIEHVVFALQDRHAGLAVAVGGETETEGVDHLVEAERADAQLVFGNRNRSAGVLKSVRPDHEHPVVVRGRRHADSVDRSAALNAVGLADRCRARRRGAQEDEDDCRGGAKTHHDRKLLTDVACMEVDVL
jgi:hypothetical protein